VLLTVAVVSAIQGVQYVVMGQTGQNIFSAWFQVGLILGVITLNTWIGIYQEGNAEKAADALKSLLSTDARVIRGGKEIMIPAGDIVPGDVCLLGLGDKIPADLRMISVSNLATGEAALTGESVPIDKVRICTVICTFCVHYVPIFAFDLYQYIIIICSIEKSNP
jgi:P-type E1-E2 ATPase